jgi:hypothetical protein
VLNDNSPMALYRCADSIEKLEWIFDIDYIKEVVGGAASYKALIASAPPQHIVVFLFKKIGPLVVLHVEKQILQEALEELREDS